MSPVAPSGNHAGRALLTGTLAIVVIGVILFLAAVVLGNRNSTDLRLGDQTFHAGSTERQAKAIAKGGPILYSDVSGEKGRDMILQHLGPNENTGWYAFRAQPADRARDCVWEWQKDQRRFRAACDHSLTAPANGAGLEHYKVHVSDGQIEVDLNFAARTTTTSTAPESGNVPSTTEKP
jgi:hypothetical protein